MKFMCGSEKSCDGLSDIDPIRCLNKGTDEKPSATVKNGEDVAVP